MNEFQAYCGIVCESCPIHLATLEGDAKKRTEMRIEIARQIANQYGTRFDPESVTDCDGCRMVAGRLFSGCRDCSIRRCAKAKGLESCAYCPEYACQSLTAIFCTDPQARTRLEEIRTGSRGLTTSMNG